ncbi:MAG: hypothetical protein ACKN9W_20500 [Methylococcus sp.]
MKCCKSLILLALFGWLTACAQRTLTPAVFPADYHTQIDRDDVIAAKTCAAIAGVDVENALPGNKVGKRTLQDKPVPPKDIRMTGSVPGWIKSATADIFRLAGLNSQDPRAPRLKLRLTDISINENVYVNSGYDGQVTLEAALIDGQGQDCWSQRLTGAARNYGNSGTARNYQETVNHALDRALASLLADPGFESAACRSCR